MEFTDMVHYFISIFSGFTLDRTQAAIGDIGMRSFRLTRCGTQQAKKKLEGNQTETALNHVPFHKNNVRSGTSFHLHPVRRHQGLNQGLLAQLAARFHMDCGPLPEML